MNIQVMNPDGTIRSVPLKTAMLAGMVLVDGHHRMAAYQLVQQEQDQAKLARFNHAYGMDLQTVEEMEQFLAIEYYRDMFRDVKQDLTRFLEFFTSSDYSKDWKGDQPLAHE